MSKPPRERMTYLMSTAAWEEDQLKYYEEKKRAAPKAMSDEEFDKLRVPFEMDNTDMREDHSLFRDLGTLLLVLGIIGIVYALVA